MAMTRRSLACYVLAFAGLVPGLAHAQADAGSADLINRVRGAPGGRVGGATRGIHRDDPAAPPPPPRPAASTQPVPRSTSQTGASPQGGASN